MVGRRGAAMDAAGEGSVIMRFVVLFGPPAVGKMTVGYELAKLTGFRLFHNHMTIDLVLNFFDFGTPPFTRLVNEFRTRVFEEVAASGLPGLIFTYVWALDHPGDKEFVDNACDIFRSHGAEVFFVELAADLDERLRRNETEFRLAEKRPKRDLEHSRRNLLEAERMYKLNSDGDFFYPDRHLYVDNTNVEPDIVARQIVAWLESFDRA